MSKEDFSISVFIPGLKEGKTKQKVIIDSKNSSSYKTQIKVVDGYFNDGT